MPEKYPMRTDNGSGFTVVVWKCGSVEVVLRLHDEKSKYIIHNSEIPGIEIMSQRPHTSNGKP